jgi:DnaK suppressor protein
MHKQVCMVFMYMRPGKSSGQSTRGLRNNPISPTNGKEGNNDMIQSENLQKIQQQLEKELARLLGSDETNRGKRGQRASMNPDRDDLARNFTLREQRLALHDVAQAQLTQIEKALERIDDGTYGLCAGCGKAIPIERLEIIPYATLCVNCQQKQDQN